MRQPTIRAIAVGAAMSYIALCPPRLAAASDGEAGVTFGDPEPAMQVEPRFVETGNSAVAPTPETDVPPFVWTTDLTLAPPPNLTAAMDSQFAPPPTSGTAIPLPAGAWTGFASLAGLGTIALYRKLRRGA
jgi:hypothetical protein